MIDDQDRVDLRWMPQTRKLLEDHGVTFTHALSPDPLCCPARAEVLTGQLGQNNGVESNTGPNGGFQALRDSQNTLATWLQAAGYQTALVGKYLNGYGIADGRQAGWTIWNPSIAGIYSYNDTTFYNDGAPVTYTTNVTPIISDYTVDYIHRFAATGQPFFIWASHLAPHARSGRLHAPLPTTGHRRSLLHVRAPSLSKPSFNRLGTPPWPYPGLADDRMTRTGIQHDFTRRIQTLLDVDDAVRKAVAALRETGQLDNTYIFLVSDNANLLGEHRARGKNVLYREALEIPFVVRVPDVTTHQVSTLPVDLTDLTSTITSLAGATAQRLQDGRSFAPVLAGGTESFRDTTLIQTGGRQGGWTFRGVWTGRYNYLQRVSDGASFLYDHRTDPYELHNVAPSPLYSNTLAELQRRTALLENCAGELCNQTFGPPTPPRPASR
jgi:arylsulfatase A-like enzyme